MANQLDEDLRAFAAPIPDGLSRLGMAFQNADDADKVEATLIEQGYVKQPDGVWRHPDRMKGESK